MQLNEPIRKPGTYHFKDRPALPILSETDPKRTVEENYWPMFTGCFNGVSVIIGIPEEIEALHTMGVFGKGNLSRSFPCFGKRKRGIPPIITSSRWERRVKWMDTIQTSLDGATREIQDHKTTDIRIDENNAGIINDRSECPPPTKSNISIEIYDSDEKSSREETDIVAGSKIMSSQGQGGKEKGIDVDGSNKPIRNKSEIPPFSTNSIDLYDSDDLSSKQETVIIDGNNSILSLAQNGTKKDTIIAESSDSTKDSNQSESLPPIMADNCIDVYDSDEKSSKEKTVSDKAPLGQNNAGDRDGVTVDEQSTSNASNNVYKRPFCDNEISLVDEQTLNVPESKRQREELPCQSGKLNSNNATYESISLASSESLVALVSTDNQDLNSSREKDIEDVDLDIVNSSVHGSIKVQISGSDASDNEVIVIDKSGVDAEISLEQLNPRIEHEKIKTLQEELHLMLEEAFFLSYGLGCLQVIDVTGQFLSIIGMWNLYRSSQIDFIEKYVAYHHFRSKGWVVKSGMKFGGDFVLYKKGPSIYHASYIVLVDCVIISNKEESNEAPRKTHRTVEAMKSLSRLSESCNKEILICEVYSPFPLEDITTPTMLNNVKVNECLIRRWQPSHNREGDSL